MKLLGDFGYGEPPEPMTEPCANFFLEHTRLHVLTQFVQRLVVRATETHLAAAQALTASAGTEAEKTRYAEALATAGGAVREYLAQAQLLWEMWLCRAIDNYLTYLSELLALIFTTKPETLRSEERVTIEEVLRHPNITEFVQTVAETRVLNLSYKGLAEVGKYADDRLGLKLFSTDDEYERARIFVEVRNLIVHRRGVIDKHFLQRVPELGRKVGDRIILRAEEIVSAIALFSRAVRTIDLEAAKKFGLPQIVSSREIIVQRFLEQRAAGSTHGW